MTKFWPKKSEHWWYIQLPGIPFNEKGMPIPIPSFFFLDDWNTSKTGPLDKDCVDAWHSKKKGEGWFSAFVGPSNYPRYFYE